MAFLERPEHELIRMERGLRPHVAEHGAVDANLIVLDVVALHGDRHFELFVFDAVLVGLQVADDAVPGPLLHGGQGAQPRIDVFLRARRHGHGDLLVLALSGAKAVHEGGRHAEIELLKNGAVDIHLYLLRF